MAKKVNPKVKWSLLDNWRQQAVQDALANEYITIGMTEAEKNAYTKGFVGGWTEAISTLSLQQIIQIQID